MVDFIKGLNRIIPITIQRVILAVIGLFVLVFELDGNTDDFFDFIGVLLPIALVLTAVALLELKGAHLGALLVLFLTTFISNIQSFIASLGSYDFFFEQFDDITLPMIFGFIVAVYLVMMIISYLFTGEYGFHVNIKHLLFPIIVTLIWVYMCYGFEFSIAMIIAAFIAFGFGSILGGLLILLVMPIVQPIMILQAIVNDISEFLSIYDWIVGLASIYIIYLLIKAIIPELKSFKKSE